MLTDEKAVSPAPAVGTDSDAVAAQRPAPGAPMNVQTCSRLGRHANPPGLGRSFGDWLRRRWN